MHGFTGNCASWTELQEALDRERANLERLQGAVTDLNPLIVPGADHMRACLHADFSHAVIRFVTR